jgi:hypothetical protein
MRTLRSQAVHILSIAASSPGTTLGEIAENLGYSQRALEIAMRALWASIGPWEWQHARAEAECKVRMGAVS